MIKIVAICMCLVATSVFAQDPTPPCLAELKENASLQSLYQKFPFDISKSQPLEVLANSTKVTPTDKAALSAFVAEGDRCAELGAEWRRQNYPASINGLLITYQTTVKDAMADLFAGKLTFGEMARLRAKAYAEHQNQIGLEIQKLQTQRAEAGRKEEVAGQKPSRPEAESPSAPIRRSLEEDRYQCELDASRAFPVALQQRMTSPGVQVAPNPRSQTNCTRYGTQWNCATGPSGVDASIYNRPPTYITEDVNLSQRQQVFASCMTAKGYRRN